MELLLQYYRKMKGLTQADLAERIGATRRVVSSYERGETPVPLEVGCAICDVLNITLDELCGRIAPRSYADPRQQRLNGCYESLNDESKDTIVEVVASYANDARRRVEKTSQKVLTIRSRWAT